MKNISLFVTLASLLGPLNASPNNNYYDPAKPAQQAATPYVTLNNNLNSIPTYGFQGNPFNGQQVPAAPINKGQVAAAYPFPGTTTTTTTAKAPVPNPFYDLNYVNKVNTILKSFINSPFTNTDVSALSSLGSYIEYSYKMMVNNLPSPQIFTTEELSKIGSFASTLIPSNGQSSFVTLLNKFIEFFSSNDGITDKLVANGVAISKMYPNVVSMGSKTLTTVTNYVKQQGIISGLKLYQFYNQYKSQYPNEYSKAEALVKKYSSVSPSSGKYQV